DVHELHLEGVAEDADDLLGLALAEKTVVHEDAGEPVADGAMADEGRDRGIDAAREPADGLLVRADLRADLCDGFLGEGGGRPGRLELGDVEEEGAEDVETARGVRDLRVELEAVDAPLVVGDGAEGGVLARSDD